MLTDAFRTAVTLGAFALAYALMGCGLMVAFFIPVTVGAFAVAVACAATD
jgi:hypothetical protein